MATAFDIPPAVPTAPPQRDDFERFEAPGLGSSPRSEHSNRRRSGSIYEQNQGRRKSPPSQSGFENVTPRRRESYDHDGEYSFNIPESVASGLSRSSGQGDYRMCAPRMRDVAGIPVFDDRDSYGHGTLGAVLEAGTRIVGEHVRQATDLRYERDREMDQRYKVEARLGRFEERLGSYERERRRLEEKYGKKKKEMGELQNQLSRQQEVEASWRRKLEELQGQLEGTRHELFDMRYQLDAVKGEKKEVDTAAASWQAFANKLQAQLAESQDTIREIEDKLEDTKQAKLRLHEELNAVKGEANESSTYLNHTKGELQQAQGAMQELRNTFDEFLRETQDPEFDAESRLDLDAAREKCHECAQLLVENLPRTMEKITKKLVTAAGAKRVVEDEVLEVIFARRLFMQMLRMAHRLNASIWSSPSGATPRPSSRQGEPWHFPQYNADMITVISEWAYGTPNQDEKELWQAKFFFKWKAEVFNTTAILRGPEDIKSHAAELMNSFLDEIRDAAGESDITPPIQEQFPEFESELCAAFRMVYMLTRRLSTKASFFGFCTEKGVGEDKYLACIRECQLDSIKRQLARLTRKMKDKENFEHGIFPRLDKIAIQDDGQPKFQVLRASARVQITAKKAIVSVTSITN